jgi:hypothetical protein
MAAEKRECATYLPADFGGSLTRRHAGLHCRTEPFDFAKLSGIGGSDGFRLRTAMDASAASFSPDEKLVTFASDRSGYTQVYVAEF